MLSLPLRGYKHNRLNVGRIALEQLVGALINCSLLQSGGGGGEEGGGIYGTKKLNSGLQITTLGVNIHIHKHDIPLLRLLKNGTSFGALFI